MSLLGRGAGAQSLEFSLFERYLESLRVQIGIPGLSAAIVQDGRVVWQRGLGFQDVEAAIRPSDLTLYPVNELTQTITASMALRCMDQGRLNLDERIGAIVPEAPDGASTVRELLAHLPSDPAAPYKYAPARFALLTHAIESCSKESYRTTLFRHVLDWAGMNGSVPGHDLVVPTTEARQDFDEATLARFAASVERLAVPYKVDRDRRKATRSEYPIRGINAAGGLLTTVNDLARFDKSLDHLELLSEDVRTLAWTNVVRNGVAAPTGLGWFVQHYQGQKVIWQFGSATDAYSSFMIRLPERRLTLILLANSDGLVAPFPLAEGDVNASLFAAIFLRLFA